VSTRRAILVAAVAISCLEGASARAADTAAARVVGRDRSGQDAAVLGHVALPAGFAAKAGFVVAAVPPGQSAGEQAGFGRVLDPLPFIDVVNALAASRSALAVARSEDERVTRLRGRDFNASARDVESAHDVLRRARLDTAGAEARVRSLWGEAADGEDLDALAHSLGRGVAAIARIDLPPAPNGGDVRLASLATADGSALSTVRILGHVPAVDPALQGPGYLLWIERDNPPVGSSLLASFAAESQRTGALVPASAILWRAGVPCVYVEVEENVYERRALRERLPAGDAWLVLGGVKAGERVVSRGAQQLLSAELLPRDD
jgi:hypothetical protein